MKETLEITSYLLVIILVLAVCIKAIIRPIRRKIIDRRINFDSVKFMIEQISKREEDILSGQERMKRKIHHLGDEISKLKFHNTHGNDKKNPQKEGSGQEGSSQKSNS